jgi:hypothetical protein
MGRLKGAFLVDHQPTIATLVTKLATPGGFPKGAQITVSLPPRWSDQTKKWEKVTEARMWKENDCIECTMAERMKTDGTLRKTFKATIPKLRRPRGLTSIGDDREGFVDPMPAAGKSTVKEELSKLLADFKGEGVPDWGIDRADGKKPESTSGWRRAMQR